MRAIVSKSGVQLAASDTPAPDPAEILAAQHAAAQAARAAAYREEVDPLFFKAHRGEATEQEWLDKVAEIRALHPYPEE